MNHKPLAKNKPPPVGTEFLVPDMWTIENYNIFCGIQSSCVWPRCTRPLCGPDGQIETAKDRMLFLLLLMNKKKNNANGTSKKFPLNI